MYRIAAVVLFVMSFAAGCGTDPPPPSDEVLISRFEQYRPEFERLLSITKDRARVITSYSAGDPEVQSQMRLLGINTIDGPGSTVRFRCTGGSYLHSVDKGYIFIPPESSQPSPTYVLDSLDGSVDVPSERGAYDVYRVIGDGWFLYRVVNSDE